MVATTLWAVDFKIIENPLLLKFWVVIFNSNSQDVEDVYLIFGIYEDILNFRKCLCCIREFFGNGLSLAFWVHVCIQHHSLITKHRYLRFSHIVDKNQPYSLFFLHSWIQINIILNLNSKCKYDKNISYFVILNIVLHYLCWFAQFWDEEAVMSKFVNKYLVIVKHKQIMNVLKFNSCSSKII